MYYVAFCAWCILWCPAERVYLLLPLKKSITFHVPSQTLLHRDSVWMGSRGDPGRLWDWSNLLLGTRWAPVVWIQLEELGWHIIRNSIPFILINGECTLEYQNVYSIQYYTFLYKGNMIFLYIKSMIMSLIEIYIFFYNVAAYTHRGFHTFISPCLGLRQQHYQRQVKAKMLRINVQTCMIM